MNKSSKEKYKFLLCSVVYPECKSYLEEFLDSIKNQSCKCFDFLLINDGLDLPQNIDLPRNTTIKNAIGTAVQNRLQTILYAKENNYEIITWQDCDDVCAQNRVDVIINRIDDYDILVHDLEVIDENSKVIAPFFIGSDKTSQVAFEDIMLYNFMGFGNTSVKIDKIANINIPANLIAVDWFIFSCLMLNDLHVKLIPDILGKYRQYDNNTASLGDLSRDQLEKHKRCVITHYKELINRYPYLLDRYPKLNDYYSKLLLIKEFKNYKSHDKNLLWWEKLYNMTMR